MIIFFLEKIRKIFKSLGKKENKINDLITFQKYKKNKAIYDLDKKDFEPNKNIEESIKIAVSIAFYFDEKKLVNLKEVCESLRKLSNKVDIYIFTNKISNEDEKKLNEKIQGNVKIIITDQILNDRLLPWYHVNFMKKLYINDKNITHFIYLEDDILINKLNFDYWVNCRKILKKFSLIPGFVRTEINNDNKEIYAIDFVKKSKLKSLPKIKVDENYYFVNHKFPYQGMYLYDRELMKEHVFGPSSNPDCGHGAYDTNLIDTRMINLDLMAKANIGLTYLNVPNGFFNRMVTLYNIKEKKIDNKCQIKHLSNKYSNSESWFGNIKLSDAIN